MRFHTDSRCETSSCTSPNVTFNTAIYTSPHALSDMSPWTKIVAPHSLQLRLQRAQRGGKLRIGCDKNSVTNDGELNGGSVVEEAHVAQRAQRALCLRSVGASLCPAGDHNGTLCRRCWRSAAGRVWAPAQEKKRHCCTPPPPQMPSWSVMIAKTSSSPPRSREATAPPSPLPLAAVQSGGDRGETAALTRRASGVAGQSSPAA